MSMSFPKCNQAGIEFVIFLQTELQEKQVSLRRVPHCHVYTKFQPRGLRFHPIPLAR